VALGKPNLAGSSNIQVTFYSNVSADACASQLKEVDGISDVTITENTPSLNVITFVVR
jgi:hypothetical protein